MSPKDAEKLIGGYATGSLTPAEREALLRAALEDQTLFNTLAEEEPLRELLADPATRQRLLGVLEAKPAAWRRLLDWINQPLPMAVTATAAIALVAGLALWQARVPRVPAVEVAQVRAPAASTPSPQPEAQLREAAPKKNVAASRRADTELTRGEERADSAALRRLQPPQSAPAQPAPVAAPVETPAVASEAAMPPPPPATATPVAVEPVPQQRAKLAAVVSEPPPFRFQLERLQPDGLWVQFGGELATGDQVRVRLNAEQAGFVTIAEDDRPIQTQAIQPGQTYWLPVLSSRPGERSVRLTFDHLQPATQSVAAVSRFREQGRRATGAADRPTAETKAADAVAKSEEGDRQSAGYSVTLRLTFRGPVRR